MNDDSIKKLDVPTVVFVYEGVVVGFYDNNKLDLESMSDDVKINFTKGIHKVLNDLCDESC